MNEKPKCSIENCQNNCMSAGRGFYKKLCTKHHKEKYKMNYGRGGKLREEVKRTLGKKNIKGKVTHHIDLDKNNNVKSNLYIFKDSESHNLSHSELKKIVKDLLASGVLQ